MSDTPETDAIADGDMVMTHIIHYQAMKHHAKSLERRNRALVDALQELTDYITSDGSAGEAETPVFNARHVLAAQPQKARG